MGICKGCGTTIGDQYQVCVACNIKAKQANQSDDLIKILERMNWNLGVIARSLELITESDDKVQKIRDTIKKINDELKKAQEQEALGSGKINA